MQVQACMKHFKLPPNCCILDVILRAKAYQQKLLKRVSGKSKNTKYMIESTKVHTFCDGSSHKTPEWGFGGHMADRNAFKNSDL
jgi:hypothetical protein